MLLILKRLGTHHNEQNMIEARERAQGGDTSAEQIFEELLERDQPITFQE